MLKSINIKTRFVVYPSGNENENVEKHQISKLHFVVCSWENENENVEKQQISTF